MKGERFYLLSIHNHSPGDDLKNTESLASCSSSLDRRGEVNGLQLQTDRISPDFGPPPQGGDRVFLPSEGRLDV